MWYIIIFLLIWIVSIVVSFGLTIVLLEWVVKDLADVGYVFVPGVANTNEALNSPEVKYKKYLIYVPIVNILYLCFLASKYKSQPGCATDACRIFGVAEPMTKEEEEKYKADPTAATAMLLMRKDGLTKDMENEAEILKYYNELDKKK